MARVHSGEILAALILIVLGVALLGANLGLFALSWNLVWPVLLVLLGAWFVWRAFFPSRYGTDSFGGFGDARPDLNGREIRREQFSHAFGDLFLDLNRAVFPDGENSVHASHGFGNLTVVLPRDLPVRVRGSAGMGDVFVLGERSDGIAPHVDFQSQEYASAPRKLNLDASVGFGDVRVMRAG